MVALIPMFFFIGYINSSVSTDLVVVDKPIILGSYQDVVDRGNVSVLFSTMLPEREKFSLSPPESIQGKLYRNRMLYDLTLDSFSKVGNVVKRQDAVLIGRDVLGDTFGLFALYRASPMGDQKNPNLRALKIVDEQGLKYTNVFLVGKRSPRAAREAFLTRIQLMFETGLVELVYDIFPEYLMNALVGTAPISAFENLTKKVEEQQSDIIPIGLSNIYSMVRLYVAAIIFNSICLTCEIFYHKYHKLTVTKKKNFRVKKIIPKLVKH